MPNRQIAKFYRMFIKGLFCTQTVHLAWTQLGVAVKSACVLNYHAVLYCGKDLSPTKWQWWRLLGQFWQYGQQLWFRLQPHALVHSAYPTAAGPVIRPTVPVNINLIFAIRIFTCLYNICYTDNTAEVRPYCMFTVFECNCSKEWLNWCTRQCNRHSKSRSCDSNGKHSALYSWIGPSLIASSDTVLSHSHHGQWTYQHRACSGDCNCTPYNYLCIHQPSHGVWYLGEWVGVSYSVM